MAPTISKVLVAVVAGAALFGQAGAAQASAKFLAKDEPKDNFVSPVLSLDSDESPGEEMVGFVDENGEVQEDDLVNADAPAPKDEAEDIKKQMQECGE